MPYTNIIKNISKVKNIFWFYLNLYLTNFLKNLNYLRPIGWWCSGEAFVGKVSKGFKDKIRCFALKNGIAIFRLLCGLARPWARQISRYAGSNIIKNVIARSPETSGWQSFRENQCHKCYPCSIFYKSVINFSKAEKN